MNKFYDTLTNTRGDVLPGYRAQVVNPNGTVVDIFADRSGTPFTDANGGTVNYATADSEGLVEFYWEAATGQIFQMLDPAGDLVKVVEGFADNYVIGNFSGDLPIERVVDLGDELLALNEGLLERPTTAALASTDPGKGAGMVVTESGRTVAERLKDAVSVFDYAAGDGLTDVTAALNALGANTDIKRVIVPAYYGTAKTVLLISDTVTVGSDQEWVFEGEAKILYDGPRDRAAFVIGAPGVRGASALRWRVIVEAATWDWSDSGFVGILAYNLRRSQMDQCAVIGFYIGIKGIGSGDGFVYMRITGGYAAQCRTSILLSNETHGGSIGWANQTEIEGFSIVQSSSGAFIGLSRYGIWITSDDGTYTNNNNIRIRDCNFELQGANVTGGAEGIPVVVEHGNHVTVSGNTRGEAASATNTMMRCMNSAANCVFEEHYLIYALIDNQNNNGSNRVIARGKHGGDRSPVFRFEVPSVPGAAYYDGDRVAIIGHGGSATASSTVQRLATSTSVVRTDAYVEIPSSRGVYVRFALGKSNVIALRRFCEAGYEGRIAVRLFDSSGTALTDSTAGVSSLSYSDGTTLTYNGSTLGGSWYMGSDTGRDGTIGIPAAAEDGFAEIHFLGGTGNAMRLKSYVVEIYRNETLQNVGPAAMKVASYGESHERFKCIDTIPTVGTHAIGDERLKYTPTAGGKRGFVCTTAGTPGVWKAYGLIDA